MKKFGWAYLGCGWIAHITADQIQSSEICTVVSAWNRTYEKAEAFAEKYGCKAYKTIGTMLWPM